MICGSLVARIEYNYVCIRNAEDTTVLWRTRIVRVLGPSGNGGGGGGGGGPAPPQHTCPIVTSDSYLIAIFFASCARRVACAMPAKACAA